MNTETKSPLKTSHPVVLKSMTVVDFADMTRKSKAPSPPVEVGKGAWWQPWGTIATLLLVAIGVVSVVDKHIDGMFDPVNKKFEAIDGQLQGENNRIESLNSKLTDLSERLGDAEGQLKRMRGYVPPPKERLTAIRAEIQAAESHQKQITPAKMNDIKAATRTIPASTEGFWVTVAEIINYQSRLNQLEGKAPDPTKVSRMCPGMTAGTGGHNAFSGGVYSRCIVDLDTTENQLVGVTFEDSVIRYHGGPVALSNVRFINCNFILDLSGKSSPKNPDLVLAFLGSGDQTHVKIG